MKNAIIIYNEFKDMDYFDYAESYENDLQFIQSLIDEIGISDTRKYLRQLFA